MPGDTQNRMNNTFRRKEKTKSKIINTGAERWRGCAEEFLAEFCNSSTKLQDQKVVLSLLYKKNILELGEMGGKKGETVLFLSMKVKMFG